MIIQLFSRTITALLLSSILINQDAQAFNILLTPIKSPESFNGVASTQAITPRLSAAFQLKPVRFVFRQMPLIRDPKQSPEQKRSALKKVGRTWQTKQRRFVSLFVKRNRLKYTHRFVGQKINRSQLNPEKKVELHREMSVKDSTLTHGLTLLETHLFIDIVMHGPMILMGIWMFISMLISMLFPTHRFDLHSLKHLVAFSIVGAGLKEVANFKFLYSVLPRLKSVLLVLGAIMATLFLFKVDPLAAHAFIDTIRHGTTVITVISALIVTHKMDLHFLKYFVDFSVFESSIKEFADLKYLFSNPSDRKLVGLALIAIVATPFFFMGYPAIGLIFSVANPNFSKLFASNRMRVMVHRLKWLAFSIDRALLAAPPTMGIMSSMRPLPTPASSAFVRTLPQSA